MDVVHRFTQKYPDVFTFARTAQDIEDAHRNGKIASLIGIEGGHGLDSSLAALRMFYDLGVRYITLTHSCNTPWADNSYVDRPPNSPEHNGLTDWGRDLVREMNRLGMLVDLSHVSKGVMTDSLTVSRSPVVFTHSNAYGLCQHVRNVQDDVLEQLKTNNGIIMVNFVRFFLSCYPSDERPSDVRLVADHVEYLRNKTSADHIGIGADYDGTSSLPEGLEDVSTYPNLIAELVKRGWSDLDLEKLAGRNIVRVMRAVEQISRNLAQERPYDRWIPDRDISGKSNCRSEE